MAKDLCFVVRLDPQSLSCVERSETFLQFAQDIFVHGITSSKIGSIFRGASGSARYYRVSPSSKWLLFSERHGSFARREGVELHVRVDLLVQGAALHRGTAHFEIRRSLGLCPFRASLNATRTSMNTLICQRLRASKIQHFFEHYKDLEPGKWVKLIGWGMPPRHGSLSSKRSDGPRRGNSRPVNILLQSFAEAQQFASAACRLYR